MPDYSKGQIYVIRNTVNDFVYVGSTTQAISQRWAEHMRGVRAKRLKHLKIYRAIEELGVDNFYAEFVEVWPCENKGQLYAREGHYIRKLDSVKNGYNDRVAGRTEKQRLKEDDEYREKVQKYYREYILENKSKIRENHLKYVKERINTDEKYREAVNKKQREYYHRKKAERMQAAAQTELLELK
jgi:group I intron endonuclease